ncbi:MAG: hypothetical protein DWP97_03135 [Calditrichaeota bacterium]|nr:MAG: hypothetical protein DWP97_03135 [Calditrichota bacterium]
MSDRRQELKLRVEAKKKELEQKLAELRANAEGVKNDEMDRIDGQLTDLSSLLSSGWENLTENTANKLNDWLK